MLVVYTNHCRNVTIDTDGIKGERLLTTASSADDEEQDELVPSDDESVD